MNEKRGPWYLLTGVILGIALGVLVGWGIAPVQYVDSTPSTLRSDFKHQYRYMIAAAYSATGNLERARARLGLLSDADSVKALGDQAQRMLASNTSQDVTRTLANLSQALQGNLSLAPSSPSPASPTPALNQTQDGVAQTQVNGTEEPSDPQAISSPDELSTETMPAPDLSTASPPTDTPISTLAGPSTPPSTPIYTVLPRPTRKPSSTPGAPFGVVSQSTFCEPTQPGLLQLSLQDSSGKPAAGIELVITWLGGEEHIFTGLKPELGNGYADFVMAPNVEYALSLSNGGTRVTGLTVSASCIAADGSSYPGGIRLEFKQP